MRGMFIQIKAFIFVAPRIPYAVIFINTRLLSTGWGSSFFGSSAGWGPSYFVIVVASILWTYGKYHVADSYKNKHCTSRISLLIISYLIYCDVRHLCDIYNAVVPVYNKLLHIPTEKHFICHECDQGYFTCPVQNAYCHTFTDKIIF